MNWQSIKKASLAALMGMGLSACSPTPPPKPAETPRWPTLPLAPVPPFMQGSVYERIRLGNVETFPIGGYSVVVNLHDTGDGTAPTIIREYIKKQLIIHGVESPILFGRMRDLSPEEILADHRVAVVRVMGYLPVGARRGDRFDIVVSALEGNHTSSLAHGKLWQTDLAEHGLSNPASIGANVLASVDKGDVFVNPALAIKDNGTDEATLNSSLRTGIIMGGGVVMQDRPIYVQLRQPQTSTSRLIESVIQHHWQSGAVARRQDDGVIEAYVPSQYHGDWQHFVGVMTHLYLDDSQGNLVKKAKELVAAAHLKDAPLKDISFCWEAIGKDGLAIYSPLITDPDPNIAFAAARAAAFNGDSAAKHALLNMTQDDKNPNQLAALQTLAKLPNSPEVNHLLRQLLDTDGAEVRVAAYQILANSDDGGITHITVGDRFKLDLVQCGGKPLIWASRTGIPRIAVFGGRMKIQTPVTFVAMDDRVMISSSDDTELLNVFYRDPQLPHPASVMSDNDLAEIIARLGGEGPNRDSTFNFNYNDVVAIVQKMVADKKVYCMGETKGSIPTAFVLEHPAIDAGTLHALPNESPAGRPSGHQAEALIGGDPKTPLDKKPTTRPDPAGPHAAGDWTK